MMQLPDQLIIDAFLWENENPIRSSLARERRKAMGYKRKCENLGLLDAADAVQETIDGMEARLYA